MHGGKSLAGSACPAFKHGRYSRSIAASLPQHMRERFESAMADPELLSLRGLVALCDAKLSDALERYGQSDTHKFRDRLLAEWTKFKQANTQRAETADDKAAKAAKLGAILNEVDQIIASGAKEQDAWESVITAIRERASITMQEHRRLVDLDQILTIEEAFSLVVGLHAAVDRVVKDRSLRNAIGQELEKALGLAGRTIHLPPPANDSAPLPADAAEHTDALNNPDPSKENCAPCHK